MSARSVVATTVSRTWICYLTRATVGFAGVCRTHTDRPGHPLDFRHFLVLWHGCTNWDLAALQSNPSLIDPHAGRVDGDFG